MKKIMQDIKENNFERFYLLYGSEDYLKHQYRDKLIKALVDAEDNMNYSYFEGKKINVSEMLDIGDTLPFFADNRVIVVENSGLFKKTPEGFEKRLENLPRCAYNMKSIYAPRSDTHETERHPAAYHLAALPRRHRHAGTGGL